MSTKHTPGPWKVVVGDNFRIESEHVPNEWPHSENLKDLDVGRVVAWVGNRSDDFGQQDAKLIAAVPDMLSLVVRCYRALHRDEWDDGETESELTERINDIMHSNFGEAWQQLVDQPSEA